MTLSGEDRNETKAQSVSMGEREGFRGIEGRREKKEKF